MTQVLKNRQVQINNRFSTPMQVEAEVEVESGGRCKEIEKERA